MKTSILIQLWIRSISTWEIHIFITMTLYKHSSCIKQCFTRSRLLRILLGGSASMCSLQCLGPLWTKCLIIMRSNWSYSTQSKVKEQKTNSSLIIEMLKTQIFSKVLLTSSSKVRFSITITPARSKPIKWTSSTPKHFHSLSSQNLRLPALPIPGLIL